MHILVFPKFFPDFDDPDEIIEVPVPPKPVPEIVNIENDDDNNSVIIPSTAVKAPNEIQVPPNTITVSHDKYKEIYL